MTWPFSIWMTLAYVIGLVWLARIVLLTLSIKHRILLKSNSYEGQIADPPFLSVLVAAKDEEENIESCVTTLLDQDYPNFELIIIDDRSTDKTPAILADLQKKNPDKLHVLTVTELSDGWFGKNNAMRVGVEAARGEWLCFSDADCRQVSQRTLSVTMQDSLANDCDFLSVTPVLDMDTRWAKLLQPVCALILIVWFLPRRVNDPNRKTAYANGAFMLMKRSCYEIIGGHGAVRTHVNEDIQMARAAKHAGLRLRVTENDDLYRTRMYRSAREAWHGWSRIFYGCLESLTRLGTATTLVCIMTIFPWISLLTSLAGWAIGAQGGIWAEALTTWAVVVVLLQFVTWRFYGMLRAPRIWSLAYAAGATIVVGMLLNAMRKRLGAQTVWRGTRYVGTRRLEDAESGANGLMANAAPSETHAPFGTVADDEPTPATVNPK